MSFSDDNLCVEQIFMQLGQSLRSCSSCLPACKQVTFEPTVSIATWPSDVYMVGLHTCITFRSLLQHKSMAMEKQHQLTLGIH